MFNGKINLFEGSWLSGNATKVKNVKSKIVKLSLIWETLIEERKNIFLQQSLIEYMHFLKDYIQKYTQLKYCPFAITCLICAKRNSVNRDKQAKLIADRLKYI